MPDPDLSFRFDNPAFLVAGALGEPGQRVFHLQTAEAAELVTVRCEKQHVASLASHLTDLLADLPPPDPDEVAAMSGGLRTPVEPCWIAGSLGLAYDETIDRVIIAIERLDPTADPDDEPLAADEVRGRVAITRAQAAAFVAQAAELISGGRPLCRLCGGPIDPAGHACPRSNGHRPRR